jgi:ABC-type polysaccharide/polyol phosphate export permease
MILFKNALYLAWSDTRARYNKSILGPFWLTFGNLIGVLGLSLVWGTLLKEDMTSFVPSLTIGMIVWQLVAGSIGDGPTIFVRQANMIRNVAIPFWFFALRTLCRQLINLIHNLVIVIGVIWYFDIPLNILSLLSLLGLILVSLNLFWMMYLLGMLGARFRDIEFLVSAMLPLLFFISPVIFRPDRLPPDLQLIWLNPLSYFIEVVRAPFLNQLPSSNSYFVMVGMLIVGALFTNILHRIKGKQIVFWI